MIKSKKSVLARKVAAAKPVKPKKLVVRKIVMLPHHVIRIEAHGDILRQAVVHVKPGVIEIVPVMQPQQPPPKKPQTWMDYLFGDVAS